ncbi:baseplate J/gp47 family protein, partial [Patescibacteria group bacterium]|nr:baseplate J/gp47 family protein [Patescibacteria group bacterium]
VTPVLKPTSESIKIIYKKKATAPKSQKLISKKPAVSKATKDQKPPSLMSQIIFGTLSVVSIIIIIFVVLLVLPQTTISITTQATEVPLDTTITLDSGQSGIDYINNTIPTQIITLEEEVVQEERATGEINQGQAASGTITVHNQTESALPLVSKTRFQSESGLIYRSSNSANIQPGGSADVFVVADDIGDKGNIGPSNFTLPALPGSQNIIYGRSSSSMSGGTDDITYVISEEDVQFSQSEISEKLFQKALDDISAKIPQGKNYIAPGISTLNISTHLDHQVGDQVENFNIIAEADLSFLVYEQRDLEELVNKNLTKLISAKQTVVTDENLEYNTTILEFDIANGYALINLTTTATITPAYDTETIKNQLAGKSKEEVKEFFLDYQEIQQIDIKFWPDWVKRVSKIPSRISIEIIWK